MRGQFVNGKWPRRGLCRGCVQWAATNKAHMRAGCAYSTLKSMKKQENAMECNPHSLQEALLHLDEPGNDPPFQTFVSLLRFCTSSRALSHGKALHNHIRRRGLDSSPVLGGLLVQMYGDCGALQEACHAFANIHPRSVFAWNVMIRAHAMNGQGLHALYFLQHMHHEGITPGKITFISILSICSHEGALCEGRKIHVIIIGGPFMGCVMVRNGLVNMYGKCGCLEEAQREFDMMAERNVISWTAMIAACAQNGVGKYTLQLFQQMQQEGALPDNIAFISMLDACAGELALVEGKQTHARIASCGVESDVVLGTALINLYNKCGCLKYADEVFNGMPQRNLVAWTAIIETHACHGQGKEALQLFNQMQLEGIIPNKFTIVSVLDAIGSEGALSKGKQVHAMIVGSQFDSDALVDTAIVNMYGKCHSLEDAQDAFYKLSNRDVVMWTALIAVYVQNRQGAEGLQLFSRMLQEGVMPNKVTFISALDACASKGALFDGKWIHAQALETKFESNIFVGNALVDMYGKCGSLQNARRMFDRMSERDMVTWNTMVATYAHHGHGKTALHLFHQMQQEGVPIDQVSFLTIISACSHAGLVDEGLQCFASMYQKHGIAPVVRHYNSLIDLLGRAGRLDEAENLTSNMHPQPNLVSLITLLGAYRHPADAGQGEHAAKPAVSLDLESCVADLNMMSNKVQLSRCGLKEGEFVFDRVHPSVLAQSWLQLHIYDRPCSFALNFHHS